MYVIVLVTPNLINTPKDVAMSRIGDDPQRLEMQEDETIKDRFDVIFEPIGVLEDDQESFVDLIRTIILT